MSANVFKDIGFSGAEAQLLEFKSSVLIHITQIAKQHDIDSLQLSAIIGAPKDGDLFSGKIDQWRLDTLLTYFFKLTAHLKMSVEIDFKVEASPKETI